MHASQDDPEDDVMYPVGHEVIQVFKCKIGAVDLQEVQYEVVPEHVFQIESQAVQTLLIATYPLGHDA